MENKTKKIAVVKVASDKFVKYRFRDLDKFVLFLNHRWSGWRWFNLYDSKTRLQIGSQSSKTGFRSV